MYFPFLVSDYLLVAIRKDKQFKSGHFLLNSGKKYSFSIDTVDEALDIGKKRDNFRNI